MVTVIRPLMITQATIVGPQANGPICFGPGMPASTIANPAYREPVAFEMPVVSDSTLPQFDQKRAVRYATIPVPEVLGAPSSDPEQLPGATPSAA